MQDLERMKFSQNLRQNPDDYNKYVQARVNNITDEIFNRKRTAFQKAHIDLGRYMDMDHNANYYKARTGDVDRLTTEMSANNQRIQDELERDIIISKRQFEINEWYNFNKLETLFFLQMFFISTLAMVCIYSLQKSGNITNQVAGLLTGSLCVIVIATGAYRYYYTAHTRDNRLWHRRTFDRIQPVLEQEDACVKRGDPYKVDLNDYIPKSVTQCADQVVTKLFGDIEVVDNSFNRITNNIQKDMQIYQAGERDPTPQNSLGNLICDNLNGVI